MIGLIKLLPLKKRRPWNKEHLHRLLNNCKYIGKVSHKDKIYTGEHEAIIPQELWDEVHEILTEHHRTLANRSRAKTQALLKGLIRCGYCNAAMGITYTKKKNTGKTYFYYLCTHASKNSYDCCPVASVAAGEIEQAVIDQLRQVFCPPEIISKTFREATAREGQEIARLRRERDEHKEPTSGVKGSDGTASGCR